MDGRQVVGPLAAHQIEKAARFVEFQVIGARRGQQRSDAIEAESEIDQLQRLRVASQVVGFQSLVYAPEPFAGQVVLGVQGQRLAEGNNRFALVAQLGIADAAKGMLERPHRLENGLPQYQAKTIATAIRPVICTVEPSVVKMAQPSPRLRQRRPTSSSVSSARPANIIR